MAKAKIQTRRKRTNADRYDISDYEPVAITPRGEREKPDEVPMIHAFTDADGVEHYSPTTVDFSVALHATDVLARQGEAAAIVYQLTELFGEDGYQALIRSDPTEEQFITIVTLANKIIMGSLGNSNLGKR